jgi:predicted aspartyl protease
MRSLPILLAAILATSYFASTAQAQDCGPLKRAISLDLQSGPAGLRMMVPVTINGVPKLFLLNTGGALTQLSRKTATAMGLTISTGRVTLYNLQGGAGNGSYVTVDIGVGPAVAKLHETPIQPNPDSNIDGILAPDLMANYDIEMDFAGRKLNYFLPDHCDGHVVYWPNSGVGVVPFHGWLASHGGNTHMTVQVKLDGHELIATVDTGATRTTLNDDAARELFDLSPDSAGAVPMGTMDGNPSHKVFGWVFKKLEIGDISVTNPSLAVIPNLVGKNGQDTLAADSRVRRITDGKAPSMLLGMDILSKLHLYIAYKEQNLYVTSAKAAPAATQPATESAPAH